MKGKPGPIRPGVLGRDEAERIAVAALSYLAADHERLTRFLDVTGLHPGEIRSAATEPGFLAAVLDHLCGDDALIVGLAAELGVRPERVAGARRVLSPEEGGF
jgi:hypothetical protein